MAHLLRLVDANGANAVSFSGLAGDGFLDPDGYDPRAPDVTVAEFIGAHDGGALLSATLRNVTESVNLTVYGTTTINAIERLFRQAERVQMGSPEPAIYAELTLNGGSAYRSEILTARLELRTGALTYGTTNAQIPLTLIWTRQYYWEAATAVSLELASDTTATATTNGTVIENHTDTGDGNWVFLDNADIPTGVLPSPASLIINSTSGSARAFRNVYIGQYVEMGTGHDVESFDHVLEAEDNEVAGTSDTADAGCSGGNYSALTWATSSAHTTTRWRWTIAAAQMGYARGKYFRVLARFFDTAHNSDSFVRLTVTPAVISPAAAWTTPEVQLQGNYLENLGVIRLPPGDGGLAAAQTVTDHYLDLTIRDGTGGSFNLDCIQLTPLDGWRQLRLLGGAFDNDDSIQDDGVTGEVYVLTAAGARVPMVAAYGEPIYVWPNRDQKLYFLVEESDGMVIARTFEIYASYRPRRLTL